MDNEDDAFRIQGFPAYLPLPYRVPVLVALGVFLFGTNVTLLTRAGIDVDVLFYPSSTVSTAGARRGGAALARPIYAVAVVLLALAAGGVATFWALTAGTAMSASDHKLVTVCLYGAFLLALLGPVRLYAHERHRFLGVLGRILLGGIDVTGRFLDIIVADVLTSYAKVFGDLVTTTCLLLSSTGSTYGASKDRCSRNVLIPVAIAAPYLMRLRQCLIEYRRTGKAAHLANALKYSTAFPVILISALQLGRSGEVGTPNTAFISDARLYQVWILACLVNSGYSWWWDVTMDWDLTILSPSAGRRAPAQGTLELATDRPAPYGLRSNMTFSPSLYYAAVATDFLLRMLWSVKLSHHLHGLTEWESGVFTMECLEVLRRWMWIFLRVECEHHRLNSSEGAIALNEFGGIAFTNGPQGKVDQD